MRPEFVDDPVDEFPIGAKRDADEIEFLGGSGGDGRSIRLVVAGHDSGRELSAHAASASRNRAIRALMAQRRCERRAQAQGSTS